MLVNKGKKKIIPEFIFGYYTRNDEVVSFIKNHNLESILIVLGKLWKFFASVFLIFFTILSKIGNKYIFLDI